jgi:cold shock CspA family protein
MQGDGEPPASHLEGLVIALVSGVVESFDDAAGYGEVVGEGGGPWFFHCTAIADGTRTVQVGATVTFGVVAGRLGRWEASDLRRTPSPASP